MFCWFYKLLISRNLDNGISNSRFVEKHIDSCKSCRQFYGFAKDMESKLRQDADGLCRGLEGNIVDISKFQEVSVTSDHAKNSKFIFAAAACIVMAVVFSAVFNIQKVNEAKRLRQAKSQEALKYILSTHSMVTDKLQGKDSGSKIAQVMAKPYKNEIDTIRNETKTALRFLVSCIDINIDNNQKSTTVN